MKICVLDANALGCDLDLTPLSAFGDVKIWNATAACEVVAHIADAEVVVVNKVRLQRMHLAKLPSLRLICIAATGYDNIDLDACRAYGIAVCNVAGYSTRSVTQITVAMALQLACRLPEYTTFVRDGSYTRSGAANRLEPPYHEIAGRTWGIVGYGNIGKQVAEVARALGCRVLFCRQKESRDPACVSLGQICREADILSLHVPLTEKTRGMIGKEQLALMKHDAILINVSRGAVCDEQALADAILQKRIGGIGVDVYTTEPFSADHPYAAIASLPCVCLTPHMAWGAYEARVRCLQEIMANMQAFQNGERRNRVD